ENHIVYAVGSPCSKIICLQPVYANYWIIIIRRVTEIGFDERLVECKFFAPNQGIGQSIFANFRVRFAKNSVQPVKIFAVLVVGNFGFVHVKRRNSNAARDIIPIVGDILLSQSHYESTSLNEYQIWTGSLPFIIKLFKPAPFLIVHLPS